MNKNPIPYGRQFISDEDIAGVVETLGSDYLTQGPKIPEFESAFASYVGSNYAVAVSNATAALHLCAIVLSVDSSTNVITTSITFAASANCIKYCGGNVYFADIDPVSYNLDIVKVKELIASKPKGFFKGVIPVDFAGYATNMELYRHLADENSLWIIEDACHAPGGFFIDSKNRIQNCGNGNYADLSVFSFHPVKHIACGEGGMITTNNKDLYKKLLILRTHGITKDPSLMKGNDGGWYYEMQALGYNYRLTEIQASLGISQLKRAGEGLERRRQIAAHYSQAFQNKSFIDGQSGVVEGHAYHLYVIEIRERKALYEYLKSNNILAQVHYIPVHTLPYYQSLKQENGNFPKAENYYSKCLSLPMYPTLTDTEQNFVIDTVMKFFND